MKERPILMSGPMVRAIFAGTKTQTRRAVKPQPSILGDNGGPLLRIIPSLLPNRGDLFDAQYHLDNPRAIACPYGVPGDRLWVRETFSPVDAHLPMEQRRAVYAADYTAEDAPFIAWKWTPSIHMPRWASRLTLEITAVRVERLRDISEADIEAEGITTGLPPCLPILRSAVLRDGWEKIWKETVGVESWNANPWAWVIEFKRAR